MNQIKNINQKLEPFGGNSTGKYTADSTRYNNMIYRRCGRSGILLPAISLGLWHNFGSIDPFANFIQIAHKAFDSGITHFDLANNYGPAYGSAEENFGRILKHGLGAYRDELIISTKAGYDMWAGPYGNFGSRKYLMASLDQSLKRMGLDYVDIFYSHRPDPETPFEETMGALVDIVRQGKALYIGISNYNAGQTQQALEILKEHRVPCLIHQARYSMFDRWTEPELLPLLKEEGVGMIAFSPLAQGLLSDRYLHGIPENSRAARSISLTKNQITPEVLGKIGKLNQIASERGQTLAEMALAWLLRNDLVTSVLIGASSVPQLSDNLKALENAQFSMEELNKIESILN
jgi:L-glyceraldehyde 3-phosphate reductase